ncbi:transposable element Tcb1 transposase [Trichonephila clavipes]|nr:transposable element Tcb1 transposase [Trichonephila clavipes]
MARVSQVYCHTVTILLWPARSPDLSPIEHILGHLGQCVWRPTSLSEPWARLQHIWNEMYQDIILNLYASMPDLIASCVCVRGVQQVPTDDVVIRVFIESSALDQVVNIHSGQSGQASFTASGGVLPKSHAGWLGENGQQPRY